MIQTGASIAEAGARNGIRRLAHKPRPTRCAVTCWEEPVTRRRSLVCHAVHPGLQGIVRRVDVHRPRLIRILDLKTFEDDLLPLPTEHDPHAGDGVGAPGFREPWLERQGQGVPFLRHTIAPHATEPRGEPRIRRRDWLGRGPPGDPWY